MDRTSFLSHTNAKLSAQLEEKRREHKLLQDKLSTFEGKEQEYARNLLCVNRLWEELSHDLQHLCVAAALPPSPSGVGAERNGTGGGEGGAALPLPASISDPFLRCLLAGGDARSIKEVADGCKQMEKEQCEVEQRLVARANSTKGHLAHLLKHINHAQRQEQQQQQQQQQQEDELQQGEIKEEHHQPPQGQLQHQQTVSRLQAQVSAGLEVFLHDRWLWSLGHRCTGTHTHTCAHLHKQLIRTYTHIHIHTYTHTHTYTQHPHTQVNKQAAQHRTLTAQLQASDDRWLEGQEQTKKLQNELADAEQELSNVQRKLFTMRSSSDLAAKEAAAAATLQPPSTPAAVAMGTPGPGAASTPCPAAAAQVSHALAR